MIFFKSDCSFSRKHSDIKSDTKVKTLEYKKSISRGKNKYSACLFDLDKIRITSYGYICSSSYLQEVSIT